MARAIIRREKNWRCQKKDQFQTKAYVLEISAHVCLTYPNTTLMGDLSKKFATDDYSSLRRADNERVRLPPLKCGSSGAQLQRQQARHASGWGVPDQD
jgi:hypothetical protein